MISENWVSLTEKVFFWGGKYTFPEHGARFGYRAQIECHHRASPGIEAS
jgi:hypothetical protein